MSKGKIIGLVIAVVVIIVAVAGFAIYRNQKVNNETTNNEGDENEVEKEKCEMVESYILQEYNIDGKIKESWFTYNEDGFTGGLFMYTFKVKDVNGKNFFIHYNEYIDLSKETLDRLQIRDEK